MGVFHSSLDPYRHFKGYEWVEKRQAPDGLFYSKKEFDQYYTIYSSQFWDLEPQTAYKQQLPLYGSATLGGNSDEEAMQQHLSSLPTEYPDYVPEELEHLDEPRTLTIQNGLTCTTPVLLNISEELEYHLECPITHEVMYDPWIDNEGNTYEFSAIIDHLTRSQTSPITRNPMYATEAYLRPNRPVRDIIQLYTKPTKLPSAPTKN